MTHPAGWNQDPQNPALLRYWDGNAWTASTAPNPAASAPAGQGVAHSYRAAGHGGQVEFDGDFVTITRKGFIARAGVGKGEKRIPLASISAVQWKPAGPMVNGFIQFTVPGGNERRSKFGQQTANALHDENSVVFTRGQMAEFEQMRRVIEQAIVDRSRPVHHAPAAPPPASTAEQIAQLAQLHQSGALSDAEFTQAKAKLLGI